MIKQKSIIKKYAVALYEFVVTLQLPQLAQVEQELLAVAAKLNDNKRYKKLMFSQFSPYKMKQVFISTALTALDISEVVQNFIAILIVNNRVYLLSAIIEHFKEIVLESAGVLQAEITICNDDDLSADIKQQLSEASGKKVSLKIVKDNNILGGFVLKVHNKVMDYSLKNRLNKLKKILE